MNPIDPSAEWLEADGSRRIRERNDVWNSHSLLPRIAIDRDYTAGGTNGAGERFRCLDRNVAGDIRDLITALRT